MRTHHIDVPRQHHRSVIRERKRLLLDLALRKSRRRNPIYNGLHLAQHIHPRLINILNDLARVQVRHHVCCVIPVTDTLSQLCVHDRFELCGQHLLISNRHSGAEIRPRKLLNTINVSRISFALRGRLKHPILSDFKKLYPNLLRLHQMPRLSRVTRQRDAIVTKQWHSLISATLPSRHVVPESGGIQELFYLMRGNASALTSLLPPSLRLVNQRVDGPCAVFRCYHPLREERVRQQQIIRSSRRIKHQIIEAGAANICLPSLSNQIIQARCRLLSPPQTLQSALVPEALHLHRRKSRKRIFATSRRDYCRLTIDLPQPPLRSLLNLGSGTTSNKPIPRRTSDSPTDLRSHQRKSFSRSCPQGLRWKTKRYRQPLRLTSSIAHRVRRSPNNP